MDLVRFRNQLPQLAEFELPELPIYTRPGTLSFREKFGCHLAAPFIALIKCAYLALKIILVDLAATCLKAAWKRDLTILTASLPETKHDIMQFIRNFIRITP